MFSSISDVRTQVDNCGVSDWDLGELELEPFMVALTRNIWDASQGESATFDELFKLALVKTLEAFGEDVSDYAIEFNGDLN